MQSRLSGAPTDDIEVSIWIENLRIQLCCTAEMKFADIFQSLRGNQLFHNMLNLIPLDQVLFQECRTPFFHNHSRMLKNRQSNIGDSYEFQMIFSPTKLPVRLLYSMAEPIAFKLSSLVTIQFLKRAFIVEKQLDVCIDQVCILIQNINLEDCLTVQEIVRLYGSNPILEFEEHQGQEDSMPENNQQSQEDKVVMINYRRSAMSRNSIVQEQLNSSVSSTHIEEASDGNCQPQKQEQCQIPNELALKVLTEHIQADKKDINKARIKNAKTKINQREEEEDHPTHITLTQRVASKIKKEQKIMKEESCMMCSPSENGCTIY